MEEKITKITDVLTLLIEKFGTKFVMGFGVEAGIAYLAYTDKVEGWVAVLGMAVVAGLYFFARRMQEKDKLTTKTS